MRTLSQTRALDVRTDVCLRLLRNQRTPALVYSRERFNIPTKLNSCFRWQLLRTSYHAPMHAVGSVQCGAAASADAQLVRKPRRVMLKVSGEALEGDAGFGVDPKVLRSVAAEVASAAKQGIEVAIVVGGGNFFRGVDAWDGLDRATADHMGMLATCMNAICLQSALDAEGMDTRVQTSIDMRQVAEPYIRRRAIRHLERGRIVIFGAGTGNPFFTTDTAAALRAAEIDADVFLKATKVDGVYDCDPLKFPNAKLHRALTYKEVAMGELAVMDETAITLCKENDIPVVVFNLMISGNISRALLGDTSVGTTVNSTRSEPEADSAPASAPAPATGSEQEFAAQPSAASLTEDSQLHLSRHH